MLEQYSAMHRSVKFFVESSRRGAQILLVITSLACASAAAPSTQPEASALERALLAKLATSKGDVAISFVDLSSGAEVHIAADHSFPPGSLLAVPVLWDVYFRAANDPIFSLTDLVVLSDSLPVDTVAISELVQAMVLNKSVRATNILIDLLTVSGMQRDLARIGAHGLNVEGAKPVQAYSSVTARSLLALLVDIARCQSIRENLCDEVTELTRAASTDTPPIDQERTATSLRYHFRIYATNEEGKYVWTILMRGLGADEAGELAAEVAHLIRNAVQPDSAALEP